ncbi:pericentriolar material 1 protein isoform X3 [Hydra vulgaris]|uniref:Pericentriolar material 1 protein isoform X3 n=1 Tax=Hydra vulgaris TaxID=6087 RepID=A0ABM4D3N3_HYDVU
MEEDSGVKKFKVEDNSSLRNKKFKKVETSNINHDVNESKFQKNKSNSEKARKHQQRLINFINEGVGLSSEESGKDSRRRTPMTMPRTKITAATPLEQREALVKLKQKLFSDDDKKQNVQQNRDQRDNISTTFNNYIDVMSISSVAASDAAPSENSDLNINRVNERLNQVREYLSQATSMYVSLCIAGTDEPQRNQQTSKLAKLIQQLRIQEKGYIDLIQKAEQALSEQEDGMSGTTVENERDGNDQQEELQRLKEQQLLLKKIVEQQKELEKLKERQSTLLLMQENAELAVKASRKKNVMNNQRASIESIKKQNQIQVIRNQSEDNLNGFNAESMQVEAEQKMMEWEKKLFTLQEKKKQMDQLLNTFKSLKNSQEVETNMLNILDDEAQEQLSNDYKSDPEDIESKVQRLNDVRERMNELKELITGYEGAKSINSPIKTQADRDNRLLAKTMQNNGGARMRIQNNQDINNRPVPNLNLQNDKLPRPSTNTKMLPTPSSNTKNQETKVNVTNQASLYLNQQSKSKKDNSKIENKVFQKTESSDIENNFKWQDDPEFLAKVKKLKSAKQKLYNLQQLVKDVQGGNSPLIPISDLQNLARSFSNDKNSNCEETGIDDDLEVQNVKTLDNRGDETESDDDADCEQTEDDNHSNCSKSAESFPENLTDNERRFQGLLRKQRLELNYLLKERERLLETHRNLDPISDLSQLNNNNRNGSYPSLTKEKLKQQDKVKSNDGVSTEPQYGSEKAYSMQSKSYSEENNTHPLSNPIAVSEIRRQRELYELQKKQKFVEKQQRKKKTQLEEIQSDDRGTYSVHSDEGVGVSAYSADVTTAATWGGSTAQSSNEEDSAVEDDYGATEECIENDEEFSNHSNEREQREKEPAINNLNDQPRRGITWHQNYVTPNSIRNSLKHSSETQNLGATITRTQSAPTPQSRKLRQGNLTPAHKLVSDCKIKNSLYPNNNNQQLATQSPSTEMLHTQLASMCNSLLRNEQTLLSMLQSQFLKPIPAAEPVVSSDILMSLKEYFETTNYNENFAVTLNTLQTCFERVQQHQADMEYIHQQFSQLIAPSAQLMDYRSPWLKPPSLHLSSFGDNSAVKSEHVLNNPKETQTVNSENKGTNVQPFNLFDEKLIDRCLTPNNEERTRLTNAKESFGLACSIDNKNSFMTEQHGLNHNQSLPFPYQLRMSEYNPLSYQGNFANTHTGNVMTMSRMSMNNQHAETNISEHHEKTIWPSFFKIEDPAMGGNDSELEKNKDVTPMTANPPESTGAVNFSLFESMRDLIYSEVATLIAMNESRPHYLLELFRELQLLNSDYLRQRGLYSLQELVTKFLTDSNTDSSPAKSAFVQETVSNQQVYDNWVESAQTPSESGTTTEDEGERQALQSLAKQMENNEMYDYAEIVERQSDGNFSTPRSSIVDLPFASEDLGTTVINLDEALQKMKLYELKMAETQKVFEQASNNFSEFIPYTKQSQKQCFSDAQNSNLSSEISFDCHNSTLDAPLLNQTIKALMMELVPFLNEHIGEICTHDLLDAIRCKIVHLAHQNELQVLNKPESEQFHRFFHNQLESVLKDSLSNFSSRKLKDCGEDILIVVSEILFNELAFFRLMNTLDSHPNDKVEVVNNMQASKSSSNSSSNFVIVDSSELTDEENESLRNFVKVELAVSEIHPTQSDRDDSENEMSCARTAAPITSLNYYSQDVNGTHFNTTDSSLNSVLHDNRLETYTESEQHEQHGGLMMENENAEDERDLEQIEERNMNESNQNLELEDDMVREDDLPEADMAVESSAIAQALLTHLSGAQELAGEENYVPSVHGILHG